MEKLAYIFISIIIIIGCNSVENKTAEKTKDHNDSSTNHSTKNEITKIKIKDSIASNKIQHQESTPATIIQHPEAVGIWMVPVEKAKFEANGWGASPMPGIFIYDGTYLTLNILFVESGTRAVPLKWPSKDGYYKVKTVWQQDSLFYLSPFGTDFMAQSTNGKFHNTFRYEGYEHIWEFEKITAKEVPEYYKPLLKKRKVFDYRLLESEK
jgi:hypothetical protein